MKEKSKTRTNGLVNSMCNKKRKLEVGPAIEFSYESSMKVSKKQKHWNRNPIRSGESKNEKGKKTINLAENHYELYDDPQPTEYKRIKLSKKSLFDSLLEIDHEESTPDYPTSIQEQKEVKRIAGVTPEQDARIKQIYKEQYKLVRTRPFLELKEPGEEASLKLDEETRYPIFFPDIEEVLTHVQNNLESTRWLHVKRASKLNNTVMLTAEGPGLDDYISNISTCPSLESFRVGVEFVSPLSYGDCMEHGFASRLNLTPLTGVTTKQGFQSMKCCPNNDGFIVNLDSLFNIKWNDDSKNINSKKMRKKSSGADRLKDTSDDSDIEKQDSDKERSVEEERNCKIKQTPSISLYEQDNFSRADLILSPREMANEKYPLPFIPRFQLFTKSKDEYTEVTYKSPMFGLDCEMCMTKAGSELTRISIVNEKHEIVYEKLVKPYNKIVNYLTKYSGITAKMLKNITTRLPDVQRELKALLPPDAILVGQSLNCDLVAMKMMHPYVIDTSLAFNLSGIAQNKSKLKTLCAEFLSERIQKASKAGHDSVEDALAALKLVQAKLKHTLVWGNAVLGYLRTEAESRDANLLLLEKDKMLRDTSIKARLAHNGLVDDPTLYDPPENIDVTRLKRQCTMEDSTKTNIRAKANNLTEEMKEPIVESKRQIINNIAKIHGHIYGEAIIIGSEEVLNLYKSYIPGSTYNKVTMVQVDTNSRVIKQVLKLVNGDERKLIIGHLQATTIEKVEKWSKKLMSKCNPNDLVCLSLCGSKEANKGRGAFFADLPSLKKMRSVKEVVHEYLESCGYRSNETDEKG